MCAETVSSMHLARLRWDARRLFRSGSNAPDRPVPSRPRRTVRARFPSARVRARLASPAASSRAAGRAAGTQMISLPVSPGLAPHPPLVLSGHAASLTPY